MVGVHHSGPALDRAVRERIAATISGGYSGAVAIPVCSKSSTPASIPARVSFGLRACIFGALDAPPEISRPRIQRVLKEWSRYIQGGSGQLAGVDRITNVDTCF